jgi:hypothetical protein
MSSIKISDETVVHALRCNSPWQRSFGVRRMDAMRDALEAAAPFIIAEAVKAEREACAEAAEFRHNYWDDESNVSSDVSACTDIAQAIRERGDA